MYATQQLRDEHEGILVMLTVLDHLATAIQRGEAVNTDHLEEIVGFLRTFADTCHHGKEEEYLFPALKAAGIPGEGGPIGVMLEEHTEGRAHIRAMATALAQWTTDAQAPKTFAEHAQAYVRLLRAHIEKENKVLFVMAERLLPREAHATLLTAFDRIEHERIGEGTHERYHALIHALRDAYPAAA